MHHSKLSTLALAISLTLPGIGFADSDETPLAASESREMLYTLSNAATGNQVLAFQRIGNGHLQASGQYATGGAGTGSGLGNQGALALSANERYLFAVNAGSNDISVFKVKKNGLELLDRAADDDSIVGFRFDPATGKLLALPGSHRCLSGVGTGAAQISFNQDGDALVITEKASNEITTFTLNDDGTPANAISSFAVAHDGHLTLKQSKAAEEAQPGDLAVSPDGQMPYSLNRVGSLGVYRILMDGGLKNGKREFANRRDRFGGALRRRTEPCDTLLPQGNQATLPIMQFRQTRQDMFLVFSGSTHPS